MSKFSSLPTRVTLGIIFSLASVTIICWVYLIMMVREMSTPEYLSMASLQIQHWSMGYFWMMFAMWSIMMVGMMLPSVAPMILIYAAVAKKASKQETPVAPIGAFTLGYLTVWIVFSLFATIAQWGLDKAAMLSPMMVAKSPYLGTGLLIAAGIYQWLPIKKSCLQHCRSPFHFISSHWQPGKFGAFKMGLDHGVFCLGCCWVLMLLLFVGGVMNLVWIATIALFVLLEKVLPVGDVGGRGLGLFIVALGITIFFFY